MQAYSPHLLRRIKPLISAFTLGSLQIDSKYVASVASKNCTDFQELEANGSTLGFGQLCFSEALASKDKAATAQKGCRVVLFSNSHTHALTYLGHQGSHDS
jgi:hypothetical protein